jgi:hypothetical protein
VPLGALSLPARLCLLAWDTLGTEASGAARLPRLVRAGALTELVRRGLLVGAPQGLDRMMEPGLRGQSSCWRWLKGEK